MVTLVYGRNLTIPTESNLYHQNYSDRSIKPITGSIYTWEQLLIDFRVTLPNFMKRKNKNQHEIPRFFRNYMKNNAPTI